MTTERTPFPFGKLPCGHVPACMYRYRDKNGETKKYCMACICETSGIEDIDTQWKKLKKADAQSKEKVSAPAEDISDKEIEVVDSASTIAPAPTLPKPKKVKK